MHQNTTPNRIFPNAESGSLPLGNNTLSASDTPKERKPPRFDVWNLQRKAKKLADFGARVRICQTVLWQNYKTANSVEVRRNVSGKHNFGGLYCCTNVWGCPICASRTSRKRGLDVLKALRKHHENGGRTYLITYTLKHQRQTDLKWLLETLRGATRKLKSGRWYQETKRNILGTIGGLEVTYGANGWHPHLHEIIFTRGELSSGQIADWQQRYRDKLETLGGYASTASGCDIKPCSPSEVIAFYVAKSGLEDGKHGTELEKHGKVTKPGVDFEVTGELSKRNGPGLTQWEILERSDEPKYAALWREYSKTLKGRRRLVWSRGLKFHLLGEVDSLLDEPETTTPIGTITAAQYKFLQARHYEGKFLELVNELGLEKAANLIFRWKPPPLPT